MATVREERDELQDDVFTVSSTLTRGVERVPVSDAAASACRSEVARREGLLVGLSSAAALSRVRGVDGPWVAVLVDAGDRYFSVDRGRSRGGARR
jgi:cysteine synthase